MAEPMLSVGADGLPVADEATKQKAAAGSIKMMCGVFVIGHALSFGIAFSIYRLGDTANYDSAAVAAFNNDKSGRGAYAFFAAVVWSVLTWWLNMYPTISKSRVMLNNTDIRPNMYIYTVQMQGSPHAILDQSGDAGRYNRANRSLHHFTEWAGGALFTSMCGIQVYPFPIFLVVVVMAMGRVLHQVGYSRGGFGRHTPGFLLFILSYLTIEKLCLIAGTRQLMLS